MGAAARRRRWTRARWRVLRLGLLPLRARSRWRRGRGLRTNVRCNCNRITRFRTASSPIPYPTASLREMSITPTPTALPTQLCSKLTPNFRSPPPDRRTSTGHFPDDRDPYEAGVLCLAPMETALPKRSAYTHRLNPLRYHLQENQPTETKLQSANVCINRPSRSTESHSFQTTYPHRYHRANRAHKDKRRGNPSSSVSPPARLRSADLQMLSSQAVAPVGPRPYESSI